MASRLRRRSVPDIWPGFVDAISALLIIILFLLMVFTLAQTFMSHMLSGRDEALDRLNRQVAELAEMLSLERDSSAGLRRDLAQLSSELQSSIGSRDTLEARLAALTGERDDLAAALAARTRERDRVGGELADARTRAGTVEKSLEDAYKTITADRETIRVQLATLESLRRDIAALREVRADLEKRVTTLAASLDENKEALTVTRDRSKALEAELSSARERTALAQKEIEERDVRLARQLTEAQRISKDLAAEKELSATAQARVSLLTQQITALRQELARIAKALDASEAKAEEQQTQIVNLGQRLNAALASKVEELARYRSEFFGKLREVLGDREDIRIEGDRFVFQSEVLFDSGSAELRAPGNQQIRHLAMTLREIAARIPKDLDWVLRVDGHTDRIPIQTPQFPSNWELSSARAIAVVKQLIAAGLPPHRLAAAGFGEYRPLDTGTSIDALRRNRRIEFQLTNR